MTNPHGRPLPDPALITTPSLEGKRAGTKVKVFYTFQGIGSTCLCTFSLDVGPTLSTTSSEYVSVPLTNCLVALCTSCPDMLLYPDADCAVYSANFEETSGSASSGTVWEGHGLLSWILDKECDRPFQVTGKRVRSSLDEDHIEVVLQLHPTHRISKTEYYHTLVHRRGPQITPSSPIQDDASPPAARRLPAMLPSEPLPVPSPPHDHRFAARLLPPINRRSPEEAVGGSSYDDQPFKKLRFSPPASTSPFNISGSGPPPPPPPTSQGPLPPSAPRSRTSPSLSLPPPSALLDMRQHETPARFYYNTAVTLAETSSSSSVVSAPAAPANVRVPTQHTAIGRRKKRDTKPPNVNDVRTFVQVEKDELGNYCLPVEIDSWTVLSLGEVVYDRPAFHNQRYIYPVGYKVKKWYRSMVDPRSDTQYTCEILDGGQEPIFRLEADDNPGDVYMGPTPTTVWTIAVRRAFAIRNMDYGHNPVGPDFFGLRKNTIAKMIQDLPNADKCHNYIWQTFKIGTTGRTARGKIFRPEDVTPDKQSTA
ncbi:hypothetical protein BX666DRAFT_1963106 [Dichotomocladium elegans]|nr:hypothetical protein BX666DRAFT_1963106 [Dichotomocladium elegans]